MADADVTSPDTPAPARSGGPLPHSLEAEQAVLGGLTLANDQFDNVAALLAPHDFYAADHRLIFQAMTALAEADQPLDVITLSEHLERTGELSAAGGLAYLTELADNTPSTANLLHYARIVRERATLRQLIQVAQDIARSSHSPAGLSVEELLELAEQKVTRIAEERPKEGGFSDANDLIKQALKRIDTLYNSDGDITGLSTGFKDLDAMTSGWQTSDLVVIAGRPSMGKTSFAMNMVEHALLHQDKPVLVFSLEMPADSLLMRMLSSVGKIDQTRVRNGKLAEDDWPKLSAAVTKLKDRPLYIDDTPGISATELRARVRRLAREQGNPALIMVDYLQLMRGSNPGEGRVQEISEISRSLKQVAREFNCPLLALSQLNRSLEQRPNKRPVNSDLRESGAIEQDADVIAFIYRDEVYNEDSPDQGVAEIIIGKQRNGPIGTCRLAFLGKFTKFENLAQEGYGGD